MLVSISLLNPLQTWCLYSFAELSENIRFGDTLVQFRPSNGKKTLIIVVQTILEKIITEFPSKLVYDLLRELSEMIGSSATLVQVWPSSVKK